MQITLEINTPGGSGQMGLEVTSEQLAFLNDLADRWNEAGSCSIVFPAMLVHSPSDQDADELEVAKMQARAKSFVDGCTYHVNRTSPIGGASVTGSSRAPRPIRTRTERRPMRPIRTDSGWIGKLLDAMPIVTAVIAIACSIYAMVQWP